MNLYKKVPLVNPTGYPYPPAPSEKENTKIERINRHMLKYMVCFKLSSQSDPLGY